MPRRLSAAIAILVTSSSAFSQGSPLVRAEANDNRRAAGTILTVALEAREAMWHAHGELFPGTTIEASGDTRRTPTATGPLLRVPARTELQVSRRSSIPRAALTVYIAARLSRDAPADQPDSLIVPPGTERPLGSGPAARRMLIRGE